jgi:hypothetical protein
MARPKRSNPYTGKRVRTDALGNSVPREKRPWLPTHVKQETRAERKARLRAEATAREEAHLAEGAPRSKAKRLAAKEAA